MNEEQKKNDNGSQELQEVIKRLKDKNVDYSSVINDNPQLQSAIHYLKDNNISLTEPLEVMDTNDGDSTQLSSLSDIDDDIYTDDIEPIDYNIKEDDDFEESQIDSFF